MHRLALPRTRTLAIAAILLMAAGGSTVARTHARSQDFPVEPRNPFVAVQAEAEGEPSLEPSVQLIRASAARGTVRMAAVAVPARTGDRIYLQTQIKGVWTSVAWAPQDASGRAALGWRSGFGIHTQRAAVATDDAGPARYTAPVNVGAPAPGARVVRWREWIEPGIPAGSDFTATLQRVFMDARGWASTGRVIFRYTPSGPIDVVARLATPRTTDRLCAPADTRQKWSCRNGSGIVINSDRWFRGSPTLNVKLQDYRALVVNHEIGHALGSGHEGCRERGTPAAVMMQQSKGLFGCRANAWPLPRELGRL